MDPWLERSTDDRVVPGSNPTEAAWKLWQFCLPHFANCLSEETLKAVGPFYLVVYARGSKRLHTCRG